MWVWFNRQQGRKSLVEGRWVGKKSEHKIYRGGVSCCKGTVQVEQVTNSMGSVVYLITRRKLLFTKMLLIFLLAGIPSPIYFGALIDTTCLKWGTMTCGGEGACRMYDIVTYRYIFYFILISPSYSSVACIEM